MKKFCVRVEHLIATLRNVIVHIHIVKFYYRKYLHVINEKLRLVDLVF